MGSDKPPKPASPFAALAGMRDQLPPGSPPPAAAPTPEPKGPARAVVRYERKGRGGKEATVIERLGLPAAELDAWARALKQALGCGGGVEGDAIVLAGDQRERVGGLLERRGVRRVTIA
jgi:translation initiation factor 1